MCLHANRLCADLQLNAKGNGDLTICGYLYKYRHFGALSQSSWDKRFFTLHGSVLFYYRTERDTAQHPRGIVRLKVPCRPPLCAKHDAQIVRKQAGMAAGAITVTQLAGDA